jgi:hypothetical protein
VWLETGSVRRKPGPYRSSLAPCPAPRRSFFTTWKNTGGKNRPTFSSIE